MSHSTMSDLWYFLYELYEHVILSLKLHSSKVTAHNCEIQKKAAMLSKRASRQNPKPSLACV